MSDSLAMRLRAHLAAVLCVSVLAACGGGGGGDGGNPAEPPANQAPMVSAGSDQQVQEGASVQLRGSASDPEGRLAGLQWRQLAGPTVVLSAADSLTPGFVAPQVDALTELRFELTATDDQGLQASDQVVVQVRDTPPPGNQAPSVSAGADSTVDAGAAVTLAGSASDADGSIARYQWTQVGGTPVSLSGADSANAQFVAPSAATPSVLDFRLTVTDDDGATASDDIRISVRAVPPANRAPTANAGADQSVQEGASVQLSGSGSDSDGSVVGYQWTQTAGTTVSLSDAGIANPSFTAPAVDVDTALAFQLVVTDDDGAHSAPDSLTVIVRNVPPPPDADGDGVADSADQCPNTAAGDEVDARGCSASQRDSDGDGVNDAIDQCPTTAAGTPVDARGCPTSNDINASCEIKHNLDGNRSYQVLIPSESGEQISFQVLEPKSFDCARRAQGAHPLVLHGHGFGGARNTAGYDNYRALGYTVISIDLRGHGDSSGTIRVMDPDYEGQDLIAVLDWAEQHLDYLAWRDEGAITKPFIARPATATSVARGANLVVGSIGSSYGGGYQLLLQNVDPKERLDALAPDITWHDLRWSLNPGNVIKTSWDLLLVAGGAAGSYGPGLQNGESPLRRGLDPYILETLARGGATGEFPQEALEWFRYHSPSYWCGLNGGPTMPYGLTANTPFDPNFMLTGFLDELPGSNTRTGQPGVPVLISQGMRDTLFNFNDAWWNYQCLAMRGDDVRLITHQSGHILPSLPVPPLDFGNSGGNNDCGSRKRGDATVQWFNEKLRGREPAAILAGTEDALCISLADNDAVDIPADKFLAPRAPQFQPALTGRWFESGELAAALVPQGLVAQQLHLAGQDRPGIVPLLTVTDSQGLILAGIAQADITVSTPQMANDAACAEAQIPTLRTGCDSIVFVGLGLKKSGESGYTLIDDQVLPVRGLGAHPALSLVGVGERLAAGDSLALLVYGYSPQYPLSFSRDVTIPAVNIAARLQLPLYGVGAEGRPDFSRDVETLVQRADGTPPGETDSGPDRGDGLLGLIADLSPALHEVIVALANLDPATALQHLQAALTAVASELAELIAGDRDSLLALLTHLADNLAGGDPQTALEQAGDDAGGLLGLDTDPLSAVQRAGSAARHVEAVVLTGSQLPGWSAPSAQGLPHPYPSGTGLIDQCESAGIPSEFCQGVLGTLAGTPLDTSIRSAHNGTFLYPPNWQVGDEPVSGGVPVGEIAAYAYVGTGWTEIPVQIDEKFPYFLANSHSDFGIYSGTDEELTYAFDLERWNPGDSADGCTAVAPKGTPDPVGGLDDDDELVFMAKDAGGMAPTGSVPVGVPADAPSQLVTLADPLDPATTRIVYLFRKPGGSRFTGQHYVRYTRDANADQWIDRSFFADDDPEKIGTSNTGYGANLQGTVCHPTEGRKQSNDRFPRDGVTVQTDTYVWKASGRWMVREIGIAKPDGSGNYGPDLIDRWKGRAFQQSPDSTISLVGFEDEQVNWEANAVLLGERCGPVRCIRETWGADSGTNVTKTESFYRDAVSYRYHVRVHPIPPDGLYTSWDYNRGAMVPTPAEQKAGVPEGRYYTILRPQGVPIDGVNDDLGQIDSVAPVAGYCLTSDGPQPSRDGRCPLFLDVADASFNLPLAFANWEQVSGKGDLGSLVYTFELKGLTSLATPAVVPYYRDDACLDDGTGDDPVQRPYPGEASTDPRVVAGYTDRNGDGVIGCEEKQGVYAQHGVHYFFTGDVDNAFLVGKPINEIDGLQWQFMVPTAQPTNVGEPYANVSRIPLKAVAVPLSVGLPALPTP